MPPHLLFTFYLGVWWSVFSQIDHIGVYRTPPTKSVIYASGCTYLRACFAGVPGLAVGWLVRFVLGAHVSCHSDSQPTDSEFNQITVLPQCVLSPRMVSTSKTALGNELTWGKKLMSATITGSKKRFRTVITSTRITARVRGLSLSTTQCPLEP